MNKMKYWLTTMAVLLFSITVSAHSLGLFTDSQTSVLDSGICGDNLTWILTDDGKLTIEGTDAMYSYGWSDSPLYSYRELITEVVIPEGVTNIGEGFFWDCTGLTEITIPAGVTSIDNYAFPGCRNLVSVSVPESVTSIGDYAFQSCESLTTINIPEGVTSIMNNTFQDCNSLASITIPAGVTSIGSHAFWGCSGLTSIICNAVTPPAIADEWTINEVDRSIPIYVPAASVKDYKAAEYWNEFANIQPIIIDFGSCGDNLTWKYIDGGELVIEGTGTMNDKPWESYNGFITKVTIKGGVTSIVDWAFNQCSNLTEVSIAESVTHIGNDAFRECSILGSLTLPEGLTHLGSGVFINCYNLASIIIPDGVRNIYISTFDGCSNLSSVTISAGMESISGWAFAWCYNLATIVCKASTPPTLDANALDGVDRGTTVYVPAASVEDYKAATYWSEFTNIQAVSIASGTCGDNLTWKLTDDGKLTIEGTGAMYSYGWSDSPLYIHRELITEVVIPEGVTNIGEGFFWDCTGLTEITIPAGVTSIDNYAFPGCRNLVSVSVPESVTSIGDYAFQSCESLTTINIPEGVTSIMNNTFQDCNSLASITIPAGVTSIGSHAFWGCSGLTSVICKAATPPAIADEWTIFDVDRSVPVYVPTASVEAYKSAEYWNEFTDIQPLTRYTLTISSAGYATMYLDYAVVIPEGVEVFFASSVEGDCLKMTKVVGVLPAGTGVIVKAAEGTYTFIESAETPDAIEGNLLVGTTTKTLITAESGYAYYVLAKKKGLVAMYKPQLDDGQFYNNANKAYLMFKVDDLGIFDDETNTEEEGGQLSNRLRFDFGGTTSIDHSEFSTQHSALIFDLQGRRVADTEGLKGVYIVNGRKVVF